MESEWKAMAFDIVEYRDTGTYILRATDGIWDAIKFRDHYTAPPLIKIDISQLLDDHLAMTQSMSFSVFKKPFEDRISRLFRIDRKEYFINVRVGGNQNLA